MIKPLLTSIEREKMNKIALITVTKKGVEQAKKIKKSYTKALIDIYTMEKFSDECTIAIKGSFKEQVGEIFSEYKSIIFITAVGIAVRAIAPYIKTKDIDPCVLVIDEGSDFIIPILSGHLGGGNELAQDISQSIGAYPLITTSSDISGKIAVDTLAQKINGKLESLESAKKVTSLIVAGERVSIKVPQNIGDNNPSGVIVISNREKIEITQIIPKNISIGIGCKKDTPKEKIIEIIENILKSLNISTKAIRVMGTVDIKKDEIGIIESAKYFNVPLKIISRDEIKKIEDKFETSDFVRKTIGVGAVSAPCSILASEREGKLLIEKSRFQGITVSVYEEETKNG